MFAAHIHIYIYIKQSLALGQERSKNKPLTPQTVEGFHLSPLNYLEGTYEARQHLDIQFVVIHLSADLHCQVQLPSYQGSKKNRTCISVYIRVVLSVLCFNAAYNKYAHMILLICGTVVD